MNKKLEEIVIEMYIDRQEGKLFEYHPDTVTHKFKKYVKRANIEKDIHLHNLPGSGQSRGGIHLHHTSSCREWSRLAG